MKAGDQPSSSSPSPMKKNEKPQTLSNSSPTTPSRASPTNKPANTTNTNNNSNATSTPTNTNGTNTPNTAPVRPSTAASQAGGTIRGPRPTAVHVTKNQQQLVAAKEGNIKLMRQQMEALRAAQKKMAQEEER